MKQKEILFILPFSLLLILGLLITCKKMEKKSTPIPEKEIQLSNHFYLLQKKIAIQIAQNYTDNMAYISDLNGNLVPRISLDAVKNTADLAKLHLINFDESPDPTFILNLNAGNTQNILDLNKKVLLGILQTMENKKYYSIDLDLFKEIGFFSTND